MNLHERAIRKMAEIRAEKAAEMRASNKETVTHDTDALLLKYAPKSQDINVCISKMKDHIDKLQAEKDDLRAQCLFTRREAEAWRRVCESMEKKRDQLFEIIEDAPHSRYCLANVRKTPHGATINSGGNDRCNCWKSEATE